MTDPWADIDIFADAEEYWEAENWGLEFWTDHPTFLATDVALLKHLSPSALKAVAQGLAATATDEMKAEVRRKHGARGAAIRNASTMSKEQVAALCWQIEDKLNSTRTTKPMSKAQAAEKIAPLVSAELGKEYKTSYIRQLLLMRGKI